MDTIANKHLWMYLSLTSYKYTQVHLNNDIINDEHIVLQKNIDANPNKTATNSYVSSISHLTSFHVWRFNLRLILHLFLKIQQHDQSLPNNLWTPVQLPGSTLHCRCNIDYITSKFKEKIHWKKILLKISCYLSYFLFFLFI